MILEEFELLKSRMYAVRDIHVSIKNEAENETQHALVDMKIAAYNECIELVTDHQNKVTEQQQLIGATQ